MEKYFKQLLLKDICSRLPYNPYCKVKDIKEPVKLLQIEVSDVESFIDWLNENYFDYRGLIEKGLALPAPEGMYMV